MDTSLLLPRAPCEPLPELEEFLKPFSALFRRRECHMALERYLTGLLTEHPVKNCDTLAAVMPGASERQLPALRTQIVRDEAARNQRRVRPMRSPKTDGDDVRIGDDSGFAKHGQRSVDVARHYPGTLGKVANCQIAVSFLVWLELRERERIIRRGRPRRAFSPSTASILDHKK